MNRVLFSSQSVEWYTPDGLYAQLEAEFGPFDLDPCAGPDAKPRGAKRHGDTIWSGLAFPWVGRVYVNPPYGKPLPQWVKKAKESADGGATVVMLVPSRTDTKWWHRYIWDNEKYASREGVQVRFIEGRLKFANSKWSAPFPSVVVIFRPPVNSNSASVREEATDGR